MVSAFVLGVVALIVGAAVSAPVIAVVGAVALAVAAVARAWWLGTLRFHLMVAGVLLVVIAIAALVSAFG